MHIGKTVLISLLFCAVFCTGIHGKELPDFSDRWIALVMEYSSSDYAKRYIEGVREQAEELGLRLEFLDAKGNKNAMPGLIDDVTLRGVDGLVFSHGTQALLEASLKRTVRKEIPVVAIHCDLDMEGIILLDQDDREMARLLMEQIIADTEGKAKMALIWIGGFEPMDLRMEVYKPMMEENPGLVELTRFGTAGPGTALRTELTMKQTLAAIPKGYIDVVFATWDEYAKGAARAIMAAGRDEISLYGMDFSDSVLRMLQDPENPWVASVGVDSKVLGKIQVRMLAYAMAGYEVPRWFALQPVLITQSMLPKDEPVTMANLHRFIPGWGESSLFQFNDLEKAGR